MHSEIKIMLAILLVALMPALVVAQEEETETETKTKGTAELGIWDTSVDGNPANVLEYEPDGTGPWVKADIISAGKNGIRYEGDIRDSNWMTNDLDFDINRMFRSYNTLNILLHRLGHESIDFYQAATVHGRSVIRTDLNPDSEYEIDYQLFQTWNQIQPKGFSNLTVGFGYRDQRRDGTRQQTIVSHCDTCHVQSFDRAQNEKTQDIGLDLTWAFSQGFVRAAYNNREYSDSPTSVDFTYDRALHPELRTPIWDNRMQYDAINSPTPVDLRNDTNKDTLSLDGLWTSTNGLNIQAEGVWSETKNEGTNIRSDFSGYAGNVTKRFGADRKWGIRWRGRAYEVTVDDYFVDSIERVAIAGPHTGRTYREVYDYDPDFLRQSTRNRDVLTSKADVSYRFNRTMGQVRGFWDYKTIDRQYYEVNIGQTKTTSNELGVSWSARPGKGLKTYLLAAYGDGGNPFVGINSKYSTLVSQPAPSPLAPTSAQYFEFQNARIAEGSASPEKWTRFEARGTYTGDVASVTANYRYWSGDNQNGDLLDWSRTNQAASVTLWSSPAPRWQWYAGYAYHDTGLDTVATIPLFEG